MIASPRTSATFPPPVMEVRRWISGKDFTHDMPLINVSQAAPVDPPPPALVDEMVRALRDDTIHLYGPVLGLCALREELAGQWSDAYGGPIVADQVGITSGCNQAFCAAIAMLCGEGDNVILPTPFYFNHKMWLDMAGVQAVPLPCGPDTHMVPDPALAETLIDARTRAIVLVTPNNPCGVEYPTSVIKSFYDLAKSAGIALIIDETYRDFHSSLDAPHTLFTQSDWPDTLVQLYSFSKAYRLTGHRVGAMVTSAARLAEGEKFLDTVSICPSQLGQRAALWGMRHLRDWLAGERAEILDRRAAIAEHFNIIGKKGWRLLGCGAYFAYVKHPFAVSSEVVAKALVDQMAVLTLPGTMFVPKKDPAGARQIRLAFANIARHDVKTLFERMAACYPYSADKAI